MSIRFRDSWFVVRGSWFVVRGSWFVVRGSWFVVRGSWFVVRGSWFVVRGSWFVVRGSWFVVRGSWFVVRQCDDYIGAKFPSHQARITSHALIDPRHVPRVTSHGSYLAFINATVVSSIRLLKPHSLSYQAETFTSVPSTTLVRVASNVLECASWLKSTDT